jgi:hypothetical protein
MTFLRNTVSFQKAAICGSQQLWANLLKLLRRKAAQMETAARSKPKAMTLQGQIRNEKCCTVQRSSSALDIEKSDFKQLLAR